MNFQSAGRALGFGVVANLSICAVAATPLPQVATGANPDESRVQKTYYVDAANAEAADDDKHGSQEEPFATLTHACQVAADVKDRGIGVKIILAPGIYRETAEIRSPPGDQSDTSAPLVIEAAEREQAVVDGADTEGWTASTWKSDAPPDWTHPWPFQRAALPARSAHASAAAIRPAEPYRPGSLLFINGDPLRQVATTAELAPGTFWLPDPAAARGRTSKRSDARRAASATAPVAAAATPPGGTVVVRPPPDTDRAGAVIQVARRSHGLVIMNRSNVVVRGLLLQHAANPEATGGGDAAGLLLAGCSNVLVEDVLSQWNDGAGVVITGRTTAPWSENITLRRVRVLHNGGSGLSAIRIKNLLAEDCETSFNDFRGEWAGWVDAAGQAGAKLLSIHQSTWRRHRAEGNACRGLWWAGDCADVSVEDAVVRHNLVSGMLIADSPGPVRVRRCEITGNRLAAGPKDDAASPAGLSIAATPDVMLEGNVIAGNAMPQFNLWTATESGDVPNFETGVAAAWRATGHCYRHNVFCGIDAREVLCELPVADRKGRGDFSFYYGTLDSNENLFWNPVDPAAFRFYDRTNDRRPGLDFAAWKQLLSALRNPGDGDARSGGLETASCWQDPLFIEGANEDFRLREGSPVAGWNLPADEGASE